MDFVTRLALLLTGGLYLLVEMRVTLAFLKQESAKMHLWERLAYRVCTSTAELLLLSVVFDHALMWLGERLSISGTGGPLAELSSGGLQLWPVIALAGVRFLIYLYMEREQIKVGEARAAQVVALVAYVVLASFLPPIGETTTITLLLILHFVGDFTFQADGVACDKGSDWRMNASHSFMYTGLFALSNEMGIINLPWEGIVFILVTHLLIDPFKARWEVIKPIWVDQCIHIVVLVLVVYTPLLVWAGVFFLLMAAFIVAYMRYKQQGEDEASNEKPLGVSSLHVEVLRATSAHLPPLISRVSITASEDDHGIHVNGQRMTPADRLVNSNGAEVRFGSDRNSIYVKVEVTE